MPTDRSLKTIFGDGAAATLIDASDEQTLTAFQYGTDGSGGDTLLVRKGGARLEKDALRFVYDLSMADGLIRGGLKRILLITAESNSQVTITIFTVCALASLCASMPSPKLYNT